MKLVPTPDIQELRQKNFIKNHYCHRNIKDEPVLFYRYDGEVGVFILDHDDNTVEFYPYNTYEEVRDPRDRIKKQCLIRTHDKFEYVVDTMLDMYRDAYTVMDGNTILSVQQEAACR